MSVFGIELSVNLTDGLLFAAVGTDRSLIAEAAAVCDEMTAVVRANEASLSASFSRSSLSLCRQS